MNLELSNDFYELEKQCLLLDILIDCEEYDEFNTVLLSLKESHHELLHDINEMIDGEKEPKEIKKIIDGTTENLNSINIANYIDCFKIILTSKYIRKLLKKHEDSLSSQEKRNLHKRLTEVLLKKIPERQDESNDASTPVRLFRIIFLNEISACSESELSIGYADIALKELEEWYEIWRKAQDNGGKKSHPYELYALYNKGLTYLHDQRNADKAIETLKQITSPFEIRSGEGRFLGEYKETEKIDKLYPIKIDELYPIYFWLFYLPSKYLIAEAYSDSFSSFNLELTVSSALKSMNDRDVSASKLFKNGRRNGLDTKIKNYYCIKFYTKLIYSAIDKRDERVFDGEDIKKDSAWLDKFKSIEDVKIDVIKKFIKENTEENSLISHLESAKALLFLEYARMFKKESGENITKAFRICGANLEKLDSSDWPDFACTFIESTIFSFQIKDYERDEDFNKYYKIIFEKLINKEWIARKKDLVEKFLECQEKLLKQCETNYKKDNGGNARRECNTYIRYQTELVNNIYGVSASLL